MKPQAVASFINNSKGTQKILQGINKNPAVCSALSSFAFAAVLRPSLIEVMPFKEKKDKEYSQASAIAAGLIDLVATVALFIPLNNRINKASSKLTGDAFINSKKTKEQFKSVTNRGLKLLSLAPISFARFSLVHPIVSALFGGEDKHD